VANFELQDNETGMKILVSGENAPLEEDIPQLFAAARKNAAMQLSDGSFKMNADFSKVDKVEQRKRVQKLAGAALGTSSDDIDVDSGMGLWERTKLDLLRDENSKMEYLEKKFGSENVNSLNVGGTNKMFYRDPKTKKMTMVDEMGASLADFTADIAGEAVTTAGAVGGAIAGTLLAPGVGTIAGATGGAALGGFLTGVTQDVASEVATGQEVDIGDITKRRGIETAIGVPIDLATAGVGRIFSRGLAGKGANKLIAEFDKAASRVDKLLEVEGARLPEVEALRTGLGSKQASEIASARPRSKLAKKLQSVRDRVGTLRESLEGRGRMGVSADEFNRISEGIANNYKRLVSEVELTNKGLANELRGQASRKMQKLVSPKVSEDALGSRIREYLAPGVKQIEETNNANWNRLREVGGTTEVPIQSITRSIKEAKDHFIRLKDPKSTSIVRELETRMKSGEKSVSFNEFKEMIDELNDVVSSSKVAGFSEKEKVASRVLDNLSGKNGLRSKIASQNPELDEALTTAIDYYKNNLLATRRSAVGRALREQLADPAITDAQVAKLAIQDPAYIRQSLNIAKQSGGGEAKALQNSLRELYLNRIGLSEGMDVKNLNLAYNDDIVRALWGDRQVRELKNLQNRINQMKDVDIVKIEQQDVNQYLNALSNDERSRIVRSIKQRNRNNLKLDQIEISSLNKLLAPVRGKRTKTFGDSPMTGMELSEFAEKFVKARPDQVKRTIKLLEDQGDKVGMQAFRQSYVGKLFDSFGSGAQVDRFGNPLWNPESFAKQMQKGKREYLNAKTILGQSGVDDLLAANKVLQEAAETTGLNVQDIFQPRYSLTSGGLQLYGVGNLIGGLRGRAMALAYSNKLGAKLMKFLTNPGTDAETEAMLRKILPALMTSSKGLQAIAIQSEVDPEFAEQIAPLFSFSPEAP
jgi:hypothetical protein